MYWLFTIFGKGMDYSDSSPPSSMCMVKAAEVFPRSTLETEDGTLPIPFTELAGESTKYLGRTDDGRIALSNYRIFLLKNSTNLETSIPLGLIECTQTRDLFYLIIACKDARTVKCSFETSEQCSEWQRRIQVAANIPDKLESLFAFAFYAYARDNALEHLGGHAEWQNRLARTGKDNDYFAKEVERLKFNLNGTWRISSANEKFALCPSYPRQLIVPACISDDTLADVANFRSSRRIPVVVWRHKDSGAVIARCSQPEVGWLGWRSAKDEELLKALADACAFDSAQKQRGRKYTSSENSSTSSSLDESHEEVQSAEEKKILIVDARSYASAVTNRARGGGCECEEYYPSAEIRFMSLGNIHAIRKSFQSLRLLCASPADTLNWLGLLEKTMWLQHLSGLLTSSMVVVHMIEKNSRPVLVHCSDGWDRTPQIVATAQLCLDPFYRTIEGFRTLVEKEWLSYGHKFADRCGHGPFSDLTNERCPVFLQWLDCVHQIHRQFPCSFEFSMGYLIKLAQHSYSCLFGTFLGNTLRERIDDTIFERTFSVWPFLSGPIYKNPLYIPNRERVLLPAHNIRDLVLWSEVFLGSLDNQSSDFPPASNVVGEEDANGEHATEQGSMIKTRSYGDLIGTGSNQGGMIRRSSDPNMTIETHLPNYATIKSVNNTALNGGSNHATTTDIIEQTIASIALNTTRQVENLTNILHQSDEEFDAAAAAAAVLAADKQTLPTLFAAPVISHQPAAVHATTDVGVSSLSLLAAEKMAANPKIMSHSNNGNSHTYETESAEQSSSSVCDSTDEADGVPTNPKTCSTTSMLHSIQLDGTHLDSSQTSLSSNPWHGSVDTSTDTLVPVEQVVGHPHSREIVKKIHTDVYKTKEVHDTKSSNQRKQFKEEKRRTSGTSTIYPEVHGNTRHSSNGDSNSNHATVSSEQHQKHLATTSGLDSQSQGPHFISRRRRYSSGSRYPEFSPNKHNDDRMSPNGPHSLYSTSGIRSSPITPPDIPDKSPGAFSCPDGLGHALSEQNMRLQQIVQEHTSTVEALQRELYGLRLELIKKTTVCNHCGTTGPNHTELTEDGSSVADNTENASNCSWEAVEEKAGIGYMAHSTLAGHPGSSTLWVPDYAVNSCTACQTLFWLGLRKHHCRKCGQIFCKDCSENWAPLPDEHLHGPVRLCDRCYSHLNH